MFPYPMYRLSPKYYNQVSGELIMFSVCLRVNNTAVLNLIIKTSTTTLLLLITTAKKLGDAKLNSLLDLHLHITAILANGKCIKLIC